MSTGSRKKIVRLLGVGFDGEDGHVRITKGDGFDVLMGSEESHEYITAFIRKIESVLADGGMDLDELSPEEFGEIVKALK